MSVINCKVYLQLNQIEDCILSSAGDSVKPKTTDPELHVPLSNEDSVNLTKQLVDRFKRFIYWNQYQT